jgi:hypothetical protein
MSKAELDGVGADGRRDLVDERLDGEHIGERAEGAQ